MPGPRSQQCAGRSHHGHLGKATGRLARQAARRLRLRASARIRRGRGGRDRTDARRPRQGLLRPRRKLRRRHARHLRNLEGLAALRPDGARHHQAQPQPRGARTRGTDPAVSGPHRNRYAGGWRAGRHGRRLDEHGPHLQGHQPTGVRAPAVGARHRGPTGPRHAGRQEPRELARAGQGLRTDSQRNRKGLPRLLPLQRTRRQARRIPPAQHRQRTCMGQPAGQGHLRRTPRAARYAVSQGPRTRARQARFHAAHDPLARPVQHHHLRHGRPLPRRLRPAPRGVHPRRRHSRAGLQGR